MSFPAPEPGCDLGALRGGCGGIAWGKVFALRRLLHGFFALTVLLGGIGAEPTALGAVPAHQDCCCGDEARCPCDLPRAPQGPNGPRCPGNGSVPTSLAVLPGVSGIQEQSQGEKGPGIHPWDGLKGMAAARPERAALGVPRELPRPPDRSLQRLSRLATFRI